MKQVSKVLPGRHPVYFTCDVRSIADLAQPVELSKLTHEFRVRAYESVPSNEVASGWSPSEITSFSAGSVTTPAAVVAVSQNDDTQLAIRCGDQYEREVRARLNI